jgi:hypothetical protein
MPKTELQKKNSTVLPWPTPGSVPVEPAAEIHWGNWILGFLILMAAVTVMGKWFEFGDRRFAKRRRQEQDWIQPVFDQFTIRLKMQSDLLNEFESHSQVYLNEFESRLQVHFRDFRKRIDQLEKEVRDFQKVDQQTTRIALRTGETSNHLSADGYVLRVEVNYEHRRVAEHLMGRHLKPNEVVHHIFAPNKSDNSPENLCVLDREQHDYWHTYVRRERELKGSYQPGPEQKMRLRRDFGGILLEDLVRQRDAALSAQVTDVVIPVAARPTSAPMQ